MYIYCAVIVILMIMLAVASIGGGTRGGLV